MNDQINKKLMVFESNPDFSDNSRGLWEYVVKNTDYQTFWVIRDKNMVEPLRSQGVNCDLFGTELSNKMITSAQYLITSSFEFAYNKKVDQVHVAAWHGFPLKVIGFFESATSDIENFEALKVITTQSDLITATSRLSQLTLSGMFALDPRKVKVTGYPRNDLMFMGNGREELKRLTNQNFEDSKLIFYLPTMRKGLKKEGAQFDDNIFNYSDYDLVQFDEFLEKNNAYIFVKVHFADNDKISAGEYKIPRRMICLDTNMLNAHFLTIYHIMNAFDVLITDYSSVFVDYLLLNRPIIFSCPDIKQYQKDRGFVVDEPSLLMPGEIVKSQKELLYNLDNILKGKDMYITIRKEKMSLFHSYIDAKSSNRVLEEMINLAKNERRDSAKEVGHCYLPGSSPLSQYINSVKSEIFFDVGQGFSEELKDVKKYVVKEDEWITLESDIPNNTQYIRFDPDDFGRYVLKDFSVLINGIPAEYELVNGVESEDGIIFYESDPQILITLPKNKSNSIVIRYRCSDLLLDAGEIIRRENCKINYLSEELDKVYSSFFWKTMKSIRKLLSTFRHFVRR